ncbi:MAG: hypothetical protein H7A51_15280 [Akkermansiaceae bacterium]|nr:hypothetical protein [Akkermansiaceae bacterium]
MSESKKCVFSFDIGHSSIGWAVLTQNQPHPEVLGCGSVIFPKDDCLASARRGHRRTRRNIRATRQRIDQLKKLFLHLKLLTQDQLNAMGHPAPHALAARSLLSNSPTLSWLELWHVLRWYAHNRGYDGNSRWAKQEDSPEDTEKEKSALKLMDEHGTGTMAETICAALGIVPHEKKISSHLPYKTLDAAFPRKVVRDEVLTILEKHKGHLPHLDDNFIRTLIAADGDKDKRAWQSISVPGIQLPRRYYGGLLFGQLIPRFDNRIISVCPISGDKVPNKANLDFLRFRWAMLIANIKADGKNLSPKQRQSVNQLMESKGRLTPTELDKHVRQLTGVTSTNIKASFEIHPDSKDALELDPALGYAESANTNKRNTLYPYWMLLPQKVQKRAINRWKKQRPVTLQWMLDECEKENHDNSDLESQIQTSFEADQKKKKPTFLTKDHFLKKAFCPKPLTGRARYSRKIMRDVYEFVLSTDRHPTEAGQGDLPAGPIYCSKEVKATERSKPITDLTNNHLIRQRIDILLRLTDDIIENYAEGNPKAVSDIIVEVARDLQEYSGLTAKEMAGELTKRLSHFKSAVKYLEENAPDLPINGSIIRKCRIAMDLDWHCPFTGKSYDAVDLHKLEREHVIPYSDRPTNALSALVLTFDWVNKLKGKRTGLQFIKDMADDKRFLTPKQYEAFVSKLKVAQKATYPDDFHRQSSRKKLMMVENYEAKDHGFTAGALSQTSHLNRLSARQLEKKFIDPNTGEPTVRIHSIPGQITAEVRKSWRLLGTLAQACPDILEPSIKELESEAIASAEKELKKQIKAGTLEEKDREGLIQTFLERIPDDAKRNAGKPRNKTEIRSITHLHHALDAATIALTHHYLPGRLPGQSENEKGAIWSAMLKRNKSDQEIAMLLSTNMFVKHPKKDREGNETNKCDACLIDIPKEIKSNLAERLAEKRVVQHIPADQSGAKLELNQWRVVLIDNEQVILTQRPNRRLMEQDKAHTERKWKDGTLTSKEKNLLEMSAHVLTARERKLIERGIVKIRAEKLGKIVGLEKGKLSNNKAALLISENYGLALDPQPVIIPFHNVSQRLKQLKEANNGSSPRVIRNGMLINITNWNGKNGLWRVFSCKASLKLDLGRVDGMSSLWREVSIPSLLQKNAIEVMHPSLTGLTTE